MKKTALIFLIIISLISCGKTNYSESPTVARVGKSFLTKAELENLMLTSRYNNYSYADIIDRWVDREVLYQAALVSEIENDNIIKSKIDIYRKDLIGRTYVDQQISSNISVLNSEIRDFYDRNRDKYKYRFDCAKVMHFFSQDDSIASYISSILKSPKDSTDRKTLLSKFNAEVITVDRGSLVDVLDNAVFSNNRTNTIIGPVQTEYGYHVIDILNRYRAGSQIDIDEAYDEIYQIIYNQKKDLAEVELLNKLRNKYKIKIYKENI